MVKDKRIVDFLSVAVTYCVTNMDLASSQNGLPHGCEKNFCLPDFCASCLFLSPQKQPLKV